jgi:hypothetical protein
MATLGTAELTIEPKLSEGFTELQSWGQPDPRVEALSKALQYVSTFDTPPTEAHVVKVAETFLTFINPTD